MSFSTASRVYFVFLIASVVVCVCFVCYSLVSCIIIIIYIYIYIKVQNERSMYSDPLHRRFAGIYE